MYNELESIVDKLANECQRGPGLSVKKPGASSNFNVNNKVASSPPASPTAVSGEFGVQALRAPVHPAAY